MSFTLTADQFTRILNGAHRLEERARAQEKDMESLLASAETDVRLGVAALSRSRDATKECVEALSLALRVQMRRNEDGVTTAQQLCVAARESHLAAERLVTDVGAGTDTPDASRQPTRHAVLVVDDYQDTRELMSMVLHDAGFIVRTASNGLEAVLAAYEMRPAVILMDVTMPILGGLEATRLIKAIDTIRDARVIAYTGGPAEDGIVDNRLFAAVLEKPALPDVVLATVRRYAVG